MSSQPPPGFQPEQLEQLLNQLIGLACDFVEEQHCFAAFGGGITKSGEIVHFPCNREEAAPEDDLNALTGELSRSKWAGGVILVDTKATMPGFDEPTDAILAIAEDRDGLVFHSLLPYSLADDGVTFGELVRIPDAKPIIYR